MTELINIAELKEIDVSRLRGVGDKKKSALGSQEISNLFDLLTFYPRRYIDRTKEARIADMELGEEASVLVTVISTDVRRIRGGKFMVNSTVTDGSGKLKLTFFNQRWRAKQLVEGNQAMIYGKIDLYRGQKQMTNPIVDLVGNKTGKVIPIYPQSEKSGLYTSDISDWLEETIRRILPPKGRGLLDPLPDILLEEHDLVSRDFAFRAIHQPENMFEVVRARQRLIFDELFRMQLVLVMQKRAIERDEIGVSHNLKGSLLVDFYKNIPFDLTNAQKTVISEIEQDLSSPVPMHRLLQGDVGSGKTLVALIAMLNVVDGGFQSALMAPTEVLAEQHLINIKKFIDGLAISDSGTLFQERPVRIELLTGSMSQVDRKKILNEILLGNVDIVIGTHALIQDKVIFDSLGLVVVDEQHRFGVEQRSILREKSSTDHIPDMLVMTATPIPRTAAMTVYGDLDVSVLDELPPGRTPIETTWVETSGQLSDSMELLGSAELSQMWSQVTEQLNQGRQAYVVCPLVDESEKLSVASAEQTYNFLKENQLSKYRLGLLHGRLSSQEKEEIMSSFRNGDIDVLIATTVIEVGVDVPNASIMTILDADRFGIAQLHQLRGRIGRGVYESFCWLVADAKTNDAKERLEALVRSTDGFELAEVDLDLRGEGTIWGERQKGRNDLKLASIKRDEKVVKQARRAAESILDADPSLESHTELLDELRAFVEDKDDEFLLKN